MGPLVVTAHVGNVFYHLDFVDQCYYTHPMLNMSTLHRFVPGGDGIQPPEPIEVEDT